MLLLIITVVIQPVMLSYAMASMNHSHHGSILAHGHDHDGHHAMEADTMLNAQQQNDHGNGSMLDNCCQTTACSPAAFMGISVTSDNMRFVFSYPQSFSFEGIDLPNEIEPPRSLLN